MAVKNVVFKVSADTSQLTKTLNEAKKALDELNKSADKAANNISKIGGVLSSQTLVTNLNAINQAVKNINQSSADAAKNIANLGKAVGQANAAANKTKTRKTTGEENKTATAISKFTTQQKTPPPFEFTESTKRSFEQAFGAVKNTAEKGNEQLDNTKKKVEETETSWRRFVQTVRAARTILAAIYVGNEVVEFGKNILNAAGNYEVLNIQFRTFFKSAEQAKLILKDIEQLAVETPFKTSELQDSARILSAYGFTANELVPTLQRLGNVVSGTNIPIQQLSLVFGQVRAAGRLMGQDLLQLVNAGFNPLQIISQRTGESMLSLRKRMEQGRISFEEINAAFIVATESGGIFNNLSKELGLTFEGRVNALVERTEIFKRKLGENLLPTARAAVEGLLDLGVALKSIGGFVKDNSAIFIALSGALLSNILNLQKYTASLLQFKILRQVVNVQNAVANAQTRLSTILTNADAAATGRAAVVKRAYATATGLATAAMRSLSAAFAANPLGFIITGLTTAISLWQVFNKEVDDAEKRKLKFPELPEPTAAQNRINLAQAEARKNVIDEANAIRSENQTLAERQVLIDNFNKAYGTNIKNIDESKDKTKELNRLTFDLAKARQSVEKSEVSKARIRATEEEIAKYDVRINQQKEQLKNDRAAIELAKKQVSPLKRQVREGITEKDIIVEFVPKTAKEIEEEAAKLANVTVKEFEKVPEALKGLDFTVYGDKIAESEENVKLLTIEQDNLRQNLDSTTDAFEDAGNGAKEYNDALNALRNNLQVLIDKFEDAKLQTIQVKIDLFTGEDEATKKFIANLKNEAAIKEIQVQFDRELRDLIKIREDAFDKLDAEFKKGNISEAVLNNEKKAVAEFFKLQAGILDDTEAEKIFALGLEFEKTLGDITATFDRRREEGKLKTNLDQIQNDIDQLNESLQALNETTNKLFEDLNKTVTRRQFGKIEENIRLAAEQEKGLTQQIYKETINRLNLEEDAAGTKLALDGATKEEISANEQDFNKKRADATREYEKKVTDISKKTNKQIVESDQERRLRQIKLWQDIGQEVFNLTQQIAQLQIQQADNAINAQQRRIEKAKEIAEQGNAEVLQLEEERLDKLVKLRQRYVAQQQALALAELVANSLVAIANAATAQPPQAVPYVIAANLAAILAGIAAAKTQIAAAGSFDTGGYTGDGARKEPAGVVHKGEFVFTQEKTRKYRSLFEDIHKGRDPFIAKGLGEKIVVINNNGTNDRLMRIEKAIKQQKGMELHISEDGIHGIVSHLEWKNRRISNKAR